MDKTMKYVAILIVSAAGLGACAASRTGSASSPPPSPACSTPAATGGSGPGAHGQGMMGQGMGQAGQGMMGQGMMGPGMMSGGMMKCPMEVAGTTVRMEEVEGGAAMIFSTKSDVAELRRRVAAMAEMHNKHPDGCPMMNMMHQKADAPDSPSATPSDHASHHP